MKKSLLILIALVLCSLSSCISVGMNDETKQKADDVVAQIKRLNDNLEAFQKDIKALTDMIHKLTDLKLAKPPAPKSP